MCYPRALEQADLQCSGSGSVILTGALERLPWCVPQRTLGLIQRLIRLREKHLDYPEDYRFESYIRHQPEVSSVVEHWMFNPRSQVRFLYCQPTDPALGMGTSLVTRKILVRE